MKQQGVSVIIPVFNAEKYIEECLGSILRQGTVIKEIICVNDGSTDKSCEVIRKLQQEDARIQLLHSNHCGVSAARNMGLKAAAGDYVMFVDADDYLQKRKLGKLYGQAKAWDADILVFGGTSCEPFKTPHWVRRVSSPQSGKVLLSETDNIFKKRGVLPAAWNKLYKRELIKELEFPTELRIAEDNVFQFRAFLDAERVIFSSARIYVYRVHENSAMQTLEGEKAKQHRRAAELVKMQLQQKGIYEKYQSMYNSWENMLLPEEEETKRGKISAAVYYAKEYGLRSLIECTIGKIIGS